MPALRELSSTKYTSEIKAGIDGLDSTLKALAALPCVDVYGLDEEMLERGTELSLDGVDASAFDHGILASILVTAERLWANGEINLSFCEADSDLQPWGRNGADKPELRAAYDRAHVWVYGDFSLTSPARPSDFR